MILYHFPTSPFARRVRLALALKGLDAELRDARANPEHAAEVKRLNPMATVPVLVDGDRVVPDSAVILEYLDGKSPEPPLWPDGLARAEAVELSASTSHVVTTFADLGMRYHPLHDHPRFDEVRAEAVGRAQRTLDAIGARLAGRVYACAGRWSAADIAVYTTVAWLEGIPKRAETFAPARHMLALGWHVPATLTAWAAQHRARPDVSAL